MFRILTVIRYICSHCSWQGTFPVNCCPACGSSVTSVGS